MTLVLLYTDIKRVVVLCYLFLQNIIQYKFSYYYWRAPLNEYSCYTGRIQHKLRIKSTSNCSCGKYYKYWKNHIKKIEWRIKEKLRNETPWNSMKYVKYSTNHFVLVKHVFQCGSSWFEPFQSKTHIRERCLVWLKIYPDMWLYLCASHTFWQELL